MNTFKTFIKHLLEKHPIVFDKISKKIALKIIKSSKFFDEEYYRKTYNIPQNIDAAEHYLERGYLYNYNPSTNFNTILYKNYYKILVESDSTNPLILYEKHKDNIIDKKETKFPKSSKNFEKQFIINPPAKKRLAIFSSFSTDAKIHDYVIFYLKGLLEIVDNIIFITDNPIFENEIKKIENIVCYCKAERHNEYDFGSYKRGYEIANHLKLLDDLDDLILCNDSCVGPIFPFKESFEEVKPVKCDFWGLTSCTNLDFHLQSYFLVFRKSVIQSKVLEKFFENIKKQNSVYAVIFYYETKLTAFLEFYGFESYSVFKNYGTYYKNIEKGSVLQPYKFLKKCRMPLVKKKAVFTNHSYTISNFELKKLRKLILKLQPTLKLE